MLSANFHSKHDISSVIHRMRPLLSWLWNFNYMNVCTGTNSCATKFAQQKLHKLVTWVNQVDLCMTVWISA